jgi:glycosyltransferase involved in cell wall biosynthesis
MKNNADVSNSLNIAFEISHLFAASGALGDKSGVYRYSYNLLVALSEYFIKNNMPNQIYLFSFTPELSHNIDSDIINLIRRPNIELLRFHPKPIQTIFHNPVFGQFPLTVIAKKLNPIAMKLKARGVYKEFIEHIDEELRARNVQVIHHSETIQHRLPNLINVVTVHDLVAIKVPFWVRAKTVEIHHKKLSFARQLCEGVICSSKSTENDFKEYAGGYTKGETRTIHMAVKPFDTHEGITFDDVNDILKENNYSPVKKQKYYIHIGTFDPRKNLVLLVETFLSLLDKKEFADMKLVLIGGRGWGELYEKIQGLIEQRFPVRTKSPIIVLNYLHDYYLNILMKNARGLVYPSHYEGFGLPVLEAMQYGVPVITSNVTSLPEVGGDASIYINPNDPDTMKEALYNLATDDELYKSCSKKSIDQEKKFTWKKTAKETLNFYDDLVKKKDSGAISGT